MFSSADFVEENQRAHAVICMFEARTPLLHPSLDKKYPETRPAVVQFSCSVTLAV